jgi:hypothetical protein
VTHVMLLYVTYVGGTRSGTLLVLFALYRTRPQSAHGADGREGGRLATNFTELRRTQLLLLLWFILPISPRRS